jgi:hypothetical protein
LVMTEPEFMQSSKYFELKVSSLCHIPADLAGD